MDPVVLTGLVLLFGIITLISFGVPIAVAVGLPCIVATALVVGIDSAVLLSSQQMFTGTNSFTLLAIPFFILAGVLMNNGGIAGRLIDAADVLVGRMPGSLAQTNVVANAMFGSVSGAAVASAAAVGNVMGARQKERGYGPAFSTAVNAASAPAGMLLPPSNTFIVYSLVSGSSIAALFMAGYGPGALWALACFAVVFLYARKRPELRSTERITFGQAGLVLWRAVPALLMITIVIGGILAGFFTPTESAAIAVLYSLILGFWYRNIRIGDLAGILLDATRTTAIVVLLVGVSSIMSWVMSFVRLPELVSEGMLGLTSNTVIILLLMMLVLLLVGTFMDPTPAILIFTPIFLPIVKEFGIDPVHFGTVIVFNLALGTITPPVGNVLFIAAKVGEQRVEAVVRRLVPFFATLAAVLLLVVFVPEISLWLPTQLGLLSGD